MIFFVFYMFVFALPSAGAEYEYIESGVAPDVYPSDEMQGLFDSLPDGAKICLSEIFDSQSDEGRSETLGEKLSLEYIVSLFKETVLESISEITLSTACIICVILFTRLAMLGTTLNSEGASADAFSFCAGLTCSLAVAETASGAVKLCSEYIETLSCVMTAMLPATEASLIASGCVTQASVSSTALMIYITLTENFMKFVLVPLGGALLALSFSFGSFEKVNISSALNSVKRVTMWLIGLFSLVFSFVLGVQNSLAKSADSLTMKTVRFAVGNSVPIVGGAVSDALTTVGASLTLVRRTVGGIGIVVILTVILPPITVLALKKLALGLCAGTAELLECHKATSIIESVGATLSIFLAFSVLSAVFFIFYVTLFMSTAGA